MAEIMRVRRIDLDRNEVCLSPETILCQGCSGDRCTHGGTRTLRAFHDGQIALAPGDRVEVVAPRGSLFRGILRLLGVPLLLCGVGVVLVGGLVAALSGVVLGLGAVVLRGAHHGDLLRIERRISVKPADVIDPEAVADSGIRTNG